MLFALSPRSMCDMAGRTHWGAGEGYLDLLCKRQHLTCESRNLVKAPTETAIPSARVRSILHINDDFDLVENHAAHRPIFHNHRFGHYHIETDPLLAPSHSPSPHFHQCTLPQKASPSTSVSEDHSEDVYKEWTERSRPMCPCAVSLLEAHPAAAGIFLCRRGSCVNQMLSLEEVDSTLAIPLNCEAQFPVASGETLPKLNPNAPEFIPGYKQATD